MNRPERAVVIAFFVAVTLMPLLVAEGDDTGVLGRWNLDVSADDRGYPSWLEIRRSGYTTLVGSYVGRSGSARPIAEIEVNGSHYRFSVPKQWERRSAPVVHEFELQGDVLIGETTDDKGRKISWEGTRAPSLERTGQPTWGDPIELFNGRDFEGWTTQLEGTKNGWVVRDGSLLNETPGNNLVSERRFDDFKLMAEFRYPKGSNSGIYLRGRYEVQIEDSFGEEADALRIGGIYGHLTPLFNASKRHGEWQTFDITLVGRRVTVDFNGERVIDRQVIPGITGGALDSREGEPGPLLLQGDHGPVEFRRLTLTPAH